MIFLKNLFRTLFKLPIFLLKGLLPQLIKDAPIIKFCCILFSFTFISMAVVKWTGKTVMILSVLTLGISINKSWFLRFIYFISQSSDKSVVEALTKRIADWLEKFSIAALLPILVVALKDGEFIKNSASTVFNASLIALITFFCSLRITKHITEGLTKICTRADLRDLIRESEFHYVKFDFDNLPTTNAREMIEEFNALFHSGVSIDESLRLILKKQGLLKSKQDDSGSTS